ncbi:MAG: hypothetical protein EB127_14070 [Alphaproteobacteria bacterium]|nr:hypothetical protein [Alphaproteobacteria bacterium]
MTATVYSNRMKVTFDRPSTNVRFYPNEPEPATEGFSYLSVLDPYVSNEDNTNKTQSSYGRRRASDQLRCEVFFYNNDHTKITELKQLFDQSNNALDPAKTFWTENNITVVAGEIEQGSFENTLDELIKTLPHPTTPGVHLTEEQIQENITYMEQVTTF